MSKFCMNCGKQVEDGINNCPYCGASQDNTINPQAAGFAGPEIAAPNKNKNFLVPVIAGAAVVLVVIIVVLSLFVFKGDKGGKNTYEAPIKGFVDFMNTGKAKCFYDIFPDFMLEDDVEEELDEVAEIYQEQLENYGKFKVSYSIKDKEEIDEDDLDELAEDLEYEFDEEFNITEGYDLDVKLKATLDGESESITYNISVYKINGEWSVLAIEDYFDITDYFDYL